MSTKNYLAMYATEKTPMFQMGGAMEGGAQDQAQDQAAAAPLLSALAALNWA